MLLEDVAMLMEDVAMLSRHNNAPMMMFSTPQLHRLLYESRQDCTDRQPFAQQTPHTALPPFRSWCHWWAAGGGNRSSNRPDNTS